MNRSINAVFLCALAGLLLVSTGSAQEVTYAKDIRPIFVQHCVKCHGKNQRAELDLQTPAAILRGGESGQILDVKNPQESLLYDVIHEGRMPPKGSQKLSAAQVDLIQRWVLSGAKFGTAGKQVIKRINQHDVLQILRLRCTVCHGRQEKSGGLDLRSKASILKGGSSGPAMVAGKPAESLLLKRVHAGQMPPKSRLAAVSVKPMDELEIATVTRWIADGAYVEDIHPDIATKSDDPLVTDSDRQFWSFQKPQAASVPLASHPQVYNAVDGFVLRHLQRKGMTFAPRVSRLTMIRRATFDLTGLPPSPKSVREFLADKQPGAYARLIDRLLASPRYGERWGRYWLDIAGYSDSEGGQHADRVRPEAYRYRDYVIRAFNSDRPYSRFLVEQIAGDELDDYRRVKRISDDIYNNIVATGFLRMAPDSTYAGITAFVPDRLEIIDDEIEVLTSSVMGLTVRCARCHSHKFDPLPQRDYYRLAAVFKGAWDEHDWLEPKSKRYLPYVSHSERSEWEAGEKTLNDEVEAVKAQQKAKTTTAKAAKEQIAAIDKRRRAAPQVRALWDRGEPTPTYILKRGNYLTPGRLVGPGVPSVLTDGKTPFAVKPPYPGATGRRLTFARWLTQKDHPLTARVFVNRIWKHHFGHGLVRTLDNFGKAGMRPSHPQLLDWLAVEFMRRDWSIKEMHRLMMLSRTYQQSSQLDESLLRQDIANDLFSRMPMRRMEGEVLRDSLLSLSGRLNERPYGPADNVNARGDGLVVSMGQQDTWRRTIYVLSRRTTPLTILDNFDVPQMNPNCIERGASIVAPQALHLLNNHRVHELSQFFAERIRREAGANPIEQVKRIYWLAVGRAPNANELEIAHRGYETLKRDWMKKLGGKEVVVNANLQLWARKSTPNKVWEKDLVSVWSAKKELRYGLIEFDVSKLGRAEWRSARLKLGVLNSAPIRQSAALITPGLTSLTWNSYQRTRHAQRITLESFGRIVDAGAHKVGTYAISTAASKADLKKLNQARQNDKIAFVLIADEDGSVYWRDWDDGSRGTIPQLVVRRGDPDPQEAADRALQNVCHAMMNSASFLYID